eukprot:12870606-Ditylum_brightwellii.AAC.1
MIPTEVGSCTWAIVMLHHNWLPSWQQIGMVGMLIAQWKDNKIFQAISTVMELGTTHITICISQEIYSLKWEFYTAVAEELMTYTDGVNDDGNNTCLNNDPLYGHSPAPIPQDYDIRRPYYAICFIDKSVMHR